MKENIEKKIAEYETVFLNKLTSLKRIDLNSVPQRSRIDFIEAHDEIKAFRYFKDLLSNTSDSVLDLANKFFKDDQSDFLTELNSKIMDETYSATGDITLNSLNSLARAIAIRKVERKISGYLIDVSSQEDITK